MTVLEKIKLQEAYQKVLNESWGDIVNAGYSSMAMGSPFAQRPYKPGTNELKSSEELQREQKNSAIAGAAGLAAGAAAVNPVAAGMVGKATLQGVKAVGKAGLKGIKTVRQHPVKSLLGMSGADAVANWWNGYSKNMDGANLEYEVAKSKIEAERTGKSAEEILNRDGVVDKAAKVQVERLTGMPYETVTNAANNITVAQAYDMAKPKITAELAKQPLQQTDRDFIDSPILRSAVNQIGHGFPLTGPLYDGYNNYHALKRQNPDSSSLSNLGKAAVKSLPIARHLVEQPRLNPNPPPSTSTTNVDSETIEIEGI